MSQLATAMNQLNQGQSMMLGYLNTQGSQSSQGPATQTPVAGPILHHIASEVSEADMAPINSGDQWEELNPNLEG